MMRTQSVIRVLVFCLITSITSIAIAQDKDKQDNKIATAQAPSSKPVNRRGDMNVNLNNGNFSVSFLDFSFLSDPIELGLSRTYNSRSNYEGLFGFGWSSNIDTYLEFLADNTILLREGGGGKTDVFVAATKADLTAQVDKLIQQLRTKEATRSETYWKNIRSQALNDEFYRRALFRKYFPSDTKYLQGETWHLRSGQEGTLVRLSDGNLQLTQNNSPDRVFDKQGNLIRYVDPVSRAYLTLKWKDKRLLTIADKQGRTVEFSYTGTGQILQAVFIDITKQKVTTSYKYDQRGQAHVLVSATDGYGNTFLYDYSADGNLTKITYHDKTEDVVSYGKKSDWVERVKSWNGSYIDYRFSVDSADPLKQAVEVQLFSSVGKPVGDSRKNSYEFKRRLDGSLYLTTLREVMGKSITETTYNVCCNLAVKINVNGVVSTMAYDDQGRLTEKKDPSGVTVFAYKGTDVQPNVVTRNGIKYTYEYEKAGVQKAQGPAGEIAVSYDKSGRIQALKNVKKGSVLKFTYNPFGQPDVIEQENFGKINFRYNTLGELLELVPTSFKDEISPIMVATKITGSFKDFLILMLPTRVTPMPEVTWDLATVTQSTALAL